MLCRRLHSTNVGQRKTEWITTVGLEIHAQLSTKKKLFSVAPNRFGGKVNTDLAPFDVALPGSQPIINREAIFLAVKAALAFDCQINPASTFDRKHYFYPDQPAGYQITQNYNALAKSGNFTVFERDGSGQKAPIEIGISQLQLEQDTARTTYFDSPPQSLIDLNRNGAPLIEIVTTPSIPSASAAGAALRKIQSTLRAVQASEANMEAGGMRCDVNVSVTTDADRHLGPSRRVEIKNLASGRIVTDAVLAEASRQITVLEAGGEVGKETRGYNVEKKETFLIRSKESATDYRYMPEPDLPILKLPHSYLEECRATLPELPDAQLDRLTTSPYSLPLNDARVLMADPTSASFYEAVLLDLGASGKNPRIVGNWIVHELFGRRRIMEESGKTAFDVSVSQLSCLIRMILEEKINGTAGKVVLQAILDGDSRTTAEIIAAKQLMQKHDPAFIKEVLLRMMEEHQVQANKFRAGDLKIRKWFVGQVMRETKGRVKALEVEAVLDDMGA